MPRPRWHSAVSPRVVVHRQKRSCRCAWDPSNSVSASLSFTPAPSVSTATPTAFWSKVMKADRPRSKAIRNTPRVSAAPMCSHRQRCSTSGIRIADRSEEHTSELQSLMRISYAVFCLKKKKTIHKHHEIYNKRNQAHNKQNYNII